MTQQRSDHTSSPVPLDPLVRAQHPCETEPGEFDHDWKFRDDSFDHEYGTERIWYWECERCGETKEMEPGDYYEDYEIDGL